LAAGSERRSVTPTERAKAAAEQLLDRYGVVTRDAVAAEAVPGGFSALYPVLRALEESGRIRRGYFVAGLGGSQFAHPGAVDRLRELRESAAAGTDAAGGAGEALPAVVLAATDPANPYGTLLPWRGLGEGRTLRAAGAHVVIVDGELAAYSGRGERELLTFLPEQEPERARVGRAVGQALARWAARTGRWNLGWTAVDDVPIASSHLAPLLFAAGFVPSGPGLRLAVPGPPSPGPGGATG
jgi:ATP-dependent Lhr-like helicase